jgi:hypothetical protein
MNFRTYDLVKKMPSNKLHNYLFQNQRNLRFANVSSDWGFTAATVSHCAAYADLDNDGDLDLVIGNNNEPAMIYRNNAEKAGQQNYIQLQLEGAGWNTGAFGAKVYLYTGGRLQFAEAYPVRGFQSSVSPLLSFGLGSQAVIDSIIVQWPGKGRTALRHLKPNQRLTIQQTDSSAIFPDAVPEKALFQNVEDRKGL